MKRKITSLIALVLLFLTAIPAQSAFIPTGIGNAVTAPEPGKFYFIQGNAQHDNIITWLYDGGNGLSATEMDEPLMGEDGVDYIWTFEITD